MIALYCNFFYKPTNIIAFLNTRLSFALIKEPREISAEIEIEISNSASKSKSNPHAGLFLQNPEPGWGRVAVGVAGSLLRRVW